MNMIVDGFAKCPHCGGPLDAARPAGAQHEATAQPRDPRWDIASLLAEAARDKTFDETTRVRVTQQDIQKLIDKRRRTHK